MNKAYPAECWKVSAAMRYTPTASTAARICTVVEVVPEASVHHGACERVSVKATQSVGDCGTPHPHTCTTTSTMEAMATTTVPPRFIQPT